MYGIGRWKPTIPTIVLVVGGSYNNYDISGSDNPVSYRGGGNPTNSNSGSGVRGALYM